MMQTGTISSNDVQTLSTIVLINGIPREVISWDVDRELPSDLPAQVIAASGVAQATGSIRFAGLDVQSSAVTPFNRGAGWLPRPGDRVRISVGELGSELLQFVGIIDKVSGSIRSGVTATIIDDHDRLSASFSHDPLLKVMPPLNNGEPYRPIGISALYYVDRVLRVADFFCTPKLEAHPAFHAPLQGSLWAEAGLLESSNTEGLNHKSVWGVARSSFEANYTPWLRENVNTPVQITMCVDPSHAGISFVSVNYGTLTDRVSLTIDAQRFAVAKSNGVEVCSIKLGEATIVTLLITGGKFEIRTNTGGQISGNGTRSGSRVSVIRTSADSRSRVAGLQVSHPNTDAQKFASLRHAPSAHLDASSLYLLSAVDAAPRVQRTTAGDLLRTITSSTLSTAWINELGVMQWVMSDALRSRAAVRTLSTLDDILDLEWEDSLLGSASKVTVTGKRPSISRGRWRNILLFEGSGSETLKSEDVVELVIEPGADEDWIMPHMPVQVIGTGNWDPYNYPTNSVTGVYYSSNGHSTSDTGLQTSITTEQIDISRYRMRFEAGTFPPDVEANISTSPTAEILADRNRNKPLPRIPGRGKVRWAEAEVTAVGAGGPGPELTHDSGPWCSNSESDNVMERVATYISGQTASPAPVITSLRIVPDPRLQLGDVVNIVSQRLLGVIMKALVVSVSTSMDASGLDMTLGVQIISSTSTFTTYEQLNKSLLEANLTYAQWQALGPLPQSYASFNL